MLGLVAAIPFPDWLDPVIFQVGPVALRWYGLAYIVGWGLALWYAMRTVARPELFTPQGPTRAVAKVPGRKTLEDFAFWILLGIILGGRIGSVILYEPQKYLADPLAILRVWEGGMAFHGGLVGVCAAIFLFARLRSFEIFRLSDLAAIGAPIGLLLGRIANFINQELWGHPTDVPWAFIFDTDLNGLPRHPSQLYEAALEGGALFLILWWLTRKRGILSRPGIASGVFIAGYGVFRMIVEQFRVPDAELLFGLTRGTAYSIPMVIIGGAIAIWALRRRPVEPSFATETAPEARIDA